MEIFTYEHLFGHKEFLKRCINSCDKSEQLGLLDVFLTDYFLPGYEKAIENKKGEEDKKVFRFDLQSYTSELLEDIQSRKLTVASGNQKEYPPSETDTSPHPENKMNEMT